MRKKSKIIIKTQKDGRTRLYINGKWQRNVSSIDFSAVSDYMGIMIICTYNQCKFDKCGKIVVENGEISRIKKSVRQSYPSNQKGVK